MYASRNCSSLIAMLLPMLSCQPALAFEDFEHREIGDLAFYAAVQLNKDPCRQVSGHDAETCKKALVALTRTRPCKVAGNTKAEIRDVDACNDAEQSSESNTIDANDTQGDNRELAYGDLVQCVDFFLTPEKMISASRPTRNNLQSDADYQRARFESPFPVSDAHSRLKQQCREDFWAIAQASHANHTHFQDEMLVSIVIYHTLAVSIARNQRNLYGALLVNAIADHYLQDFFAPGHIASPRAIQTDLVSNAMHDYANDNGAVFHLRRNDPGKVREVLASMLKYLSSEENDQEFWCRLAKFRRPKEVAQGSQCLKEEKNLIASLSAMKFPLETVALKGDRRLWRSKEEDTGLAQRLLMVAANTRSILDVLEAFQSPGTGTQVNHLTQVAWAFDIRPAFKAGDEAVAGLPFGYYEMGKKAKPPSNMAEVDDSVPASSSSSFDSKSESTTQVEAKDFHYWYPILGLSTGRESFFSGDIRSRNAIALDTPVLGGITPGGRNIGATVGLTHTFDGDVHANGAQIRVGMIIPQTETTATAWIRRLYHGGNSEHGWRNGMGVRIDQGFTSFISLYAGFGFDYGATTRGNLGSGWNFSAGLMIGSPTSRIVRAFESKIPK